MVWEMFTGIIERSLRVNDVADHGSVRQIVLPNAWPDTTHGESVAINGVCLPVAQFDHKMISFDVISETLAKTNLGSIAAGDAVNVERSLRLGARIDGHFVQGHVDGVGVLVKKIDSPQEWRYTIEAPPAIAKYLSPKGSICIDGFSLTIAAIDGRRFDVALIPTTLEITTLAKRQIGYAFNLEGDMMAKQIVTFLEQRGL